MTYIILGLILFGLVFKISMYLAEKAGTNEWHKYLEERKKELEIK